MFGWLKRSASRVASPTPPTPAASSPLPADAARSAPDLQALAEADRLRGNAWLDQGRLQEAAAAYESSVSHLAQPGSLVNLGFVLSELGRAADAEQALERALGLDPAQFDALYLLGTIALGQGRFPASAARLRVGP